MSSEQSIFVIQGGAMYGLARTLAIDPLASTFFSYYVTIEWSLGKYKKIAIRISLISRINKHKHTLFLMLLTKQRHTVQHTSHQCLQSIVSRRRYFQEGKRNIKHIQFIAICRRISWGGEFYLLFYEEN